MRAHGHDLGSSQDSIGSFISRQSQPYLQHCSLQCSTQTMQCFCFSCKRDCPCEVEEEAGFEYL